MKPIEFAEANVVLAKDQPQYLPLPVWMDESDSKGRVVSCWRFSFIERLRILFGGKLWLSVLTFNERLQPQRPGVDYPFEKRK